MNSDSVSQPFAAELRAAVARRGLPLSRIQARLASTGHQVAVSTLSQWQSGHRVPRSERSLETVTALERILDVRAGELRALAALDETPEAGHLTAQQRAIVSYGDAVERLLDELEATTYGALHVVSVHDRLTLTARGTVGRRRSTVVVRASSPADRYVVTHGVEDGGDVDRVRITARRGCRLGRVVRSAERGVVAAELLLDRVLATGENAVLELQVSDANHNRSEGYYRWTTREIPVLVVEAAFDRRLMPTGVHGFDRAREEGPELRADELALTGGDRVHLLRQPALPGVHGLRWTWPEA